MNIHVLYLLMPKHYKPVCPSNYTERLKKRKFSINILITELIILFIHRTTMIHKTLITKTYEQEK